MVDKDAFLDSFKLNNAGLRSPTKPFDFKDPPVSNFFNGPVSPIVLATAMYKFMLDNGAVGLAANQLGFNTSLFVMTGGYVCFNPKIIHYSREKTIMEEYCLSFPGVPVKVKRPSKVFVTYELADGETVAREFDGIHARIFQHEYDHLKGIVHMDKALNIHAVEAMKRKLN